MGDVVQFSADHDDDRLQRARELVALIHEDAGNLVTATDRFIGHVKQAYLEAVWLAFDFPDWETFWQNEFGSLFKVALTGPARVYMLTAFQEVGMTQREIGTATGLSAMTVSRSLSVTNVTQNDHGTSEAAGQDDDGSDDDTDDVIEAELVEEEQVDSVDPIAPVKTKPKRGKSATGRHPIVTRAVHIRDDVDAVNDKLQRLSDSDDYYDKELFEAVWAEFEKVAHNFDRLMEIFRNNCLTTQERRKGK